MAARINPFVRLRLDDNGNPCYWVEESRPGTSILDHHVFRDRHGIPYQGFLETFLLLVSPGEGGASNCTNGLFTPHPFHLLPSRFHEHHQLTYEAAKDQDPAYHGADSGSRWISHYSAALCRDVFVGSWRRGNPQYCCAQILETRVPDAQEFQIYQAALVRLMTGDNVCGNLAAVADDANNTNGRNAFHASLIGPIDFGPDCMTMVRQIIDDRGLNEHVRIFTGDFVTDVNAAPIIAQQRNIYPDVEDY